MSGRPPRPVNASHSTAGRSTLQSRPRTSRASDLQPQRWVRGRNLGVVEQSFFESFNSLDLQLPAAAMETDFAVLPSNHATRYLGTRAH